MHAPTISGNFKANFHIHFILTRVSQLYIHCRLGSVLQHIYFAIFPSSLSSFRNIHTYTIPKSADGGYTDPSHSVLTKRAYICKWDPFKLVRTTRGSLPSNTGTISTVKYSFYDATHGSLMFIFIKR